MDAAQGTFLGFSMCIGLTETSSSLYSYANLGILSSPEQEQYISKSMLPLEAEAEFNEAFTGQETLQFLCKSNSYLQKSE